LDPLTIVEDVDDNGAKKFVSPCQTGKDCDRNTNGVLDGDYYAKNGSFNNNLTMFDINNNLYVELPFRTNPVGIDRKYEFSEKQVLKHTITHEMGHAVGVPTSHTTESDCVMFSSSNNWKRDNKFGTAAKSYVINGITNKNGNP
jgi:predicted Zn-dependent protease